VTHAQGRSPGVTLSWTVIAVDAALHLWLEPLAREQAMSIELNHTIVHSQNKHEAARFLTELFGLPEPKPFGHFLVVQIGSMSLDFMDYTPGAAPQPQHYAFLVSDDAFDAIFERIRARHIPFWADPRKQHPGEINTHFGGRGLYWEDPSGHYFEILTRPYALEG
jgi:extradiol dioxygenase family protein